MTDFEPPTFRDEPVAADDALSCGECYDIAHDEMDERETCGLHADEADAAGDGEPR